MARNNVSWILIAAFAVAFCVLFAGCEEESTKQPARIETTPVVKEAPPVVKEAPPVVKEIPAAGEIKPALPQVAILTDANDLPIVIELYPEKAPTTVNNFLQYVEDGFYDGLVFHRVIPGFMIQGGGFTPELVEKQTRMSIVNEAKGGMSNVRGTIAMARQKPADSATSQFFINVFNNSGLDYGKTIRYGDGSVDTAGYTVFGKVVKGMDIVDDIVNIKTTTRYSSKGHRLENCPVKPVLIKSVKLIK